VLEKFLSTRLDTFDVSSHAVEIVLSSVSSRVETCRDEPSGIWALVFFTGFVSVCTFSSLVVNNVAVDGSTENARLDIARLVRVDTHYKFMFDAWSIIYKLLIGLTFEVIFLSVLLIPYTCGRLSLPALWTTFGRTIK